MLRSGFCLLAMLCYDVFSVPMIFNSVVTPVMTWFVGTGVATLQHLGIEGIG